MQQFRYVFRCPICEKEFESRIRSKAEKRASECESSHDMIYMEMLNSDVQRLWNFLVSGNRDYLTKTLIDTVDNYRRLR
jgi:hypothetical protein